MATDPEIWVAVARVGDVGANEVIAVTAGALALALGRAGERYFATQRRCVHRGGDLAEGIVSRGDLICPHHGWRFSTATGCHTEASQYCLATYPVRVRDDVIEVCTTPNPAPAQPPRSPP